MVLQGDLYRPMEEAFRSGTLLLDDQARRAGEALSVGWGDAPLNWGLVIVSALALAVSIPNLYRILPHIAKCFSRWRWNLTIEASLQLSRTRDGIALLCVVPFCLIVSRFRLFEPAFFERVPRDWRTLAVIAVFLAWYLVRSLFYLAAEARVSHLQTFQTARKAERNYFVILTFFLLAATLILYAFRSAEATIRIVLFVTMGLVYLLFLWRKSQILASSCSPLSTFLYLCALEFLPLGMLVAAGLCL